KRPVLERVVLDPKLAPLGVSTYITVPLIARNRILGVVLILRTEGTPYGENELQFAQELSHQTALLIDNARLLQEAEQGLRMREELLSMVAHDLRNPLTSIKMNAQILQQPQLPNGALPSVGIQRQGALIQDATTNMEKLIHDLLDLTKLESGR